MPSAIAAYAFDPAFSPVRALRNRAADLNAV